MEVFVSDLGSHVQISRGGLSRRLVQGPKAI